ncbi:MAG: hypothetical protein WA637_16485 [Terriglobales bacterium]
MSASNAQSALSPTDWHLDIPYDAPSKLSVTDPGIDDPVNDTGIGPRRGDLQLSDEFACLIRLICEGSGEFS